MEAYFFNDEQPAIDAEAWICARATEIGKGFKKNAKDVTERFAVPQPERLPVPDGSSPEVQGEPTGRWYFPRVPQEIIDGLPDGIAQAFFATFNPTIEEM